jgi:hypothetical protein
MTKLDPTLKHIGLVLRRRLTDAPSAETPRLIAEVMERLSRTGQSASASHDSGAAQPEMRPRPALGVSRQALL